jgi:hypothetical protein
MVHYSCDLCGRDVAEARFVVKIEVFAGHDPAKLTEADLDEDTIDGLSRELEEAGEDADLSDRIPPARSAFRFDLCPACHARYVRSPLAREADKKFHFSEN